MRWLTCKAFGEGQQRAGKGQSAEESFFSQGIHNILIGSAELSVIPFVHNLGKPAVGGELLLAGLVALTSKNLPSYDVASFLTLQTTGHQLLWVKDEKGVVPVNHRRAFHSLRVLCQSQQHLSLHEKGGGGGGGGGGVE